MKVHHLTLQIGTLLSSHRKMAKSWDIPFKHCMNSAVAVTSFDVIVVCCQERCKKLGFCLQSEHGRSYQFLTWNIK